MNIFKALFGSKSKPTEEVKKDVTRDFNVLKYDGVRALRERQFDYAVQCLVRAIEINGTDLECRDYLSQAYIATDNLPQAYEQLQKMAEECPDNIAVLLRMADVAYMMENYTAMADVCEKAMMLDGNNVQVYFFYARACCGHGDLTNAVVMLSKALLLNADFDAARLLRGELLLESGDVEEAAEDADTLCARIEGNEDVRLLKARVEKAKGCMAEAEIAYGKVIDANPFSTEAYRERSEVRKALGNNEGANADEAAANEMQQEPPQPNEGIEQNIKKKMQQMDPYKVYNKE